MTAWLAVAVVVGVLVGRMIRHRDRAPARQRRRAGRTRSGVRTGQDARPRSGSDVGAGPDAGAPRRQRMTGRGRQHRL